MGKGIVKLGEGQWAVKDGNLLAAKETNGRFKNTEFTVARGTDATYVGKDGLIKDASFYNLLPHSEDFTTWTVNAATTVYSNTTETLSPTNTYSASKITSDGSNGLYKAVAFSGGNNTKSVYLKGIVGGEQVILRDPAQTIEQKTLTLTTDWVRYELTENQTSTIGLWINEIPSNGIYMWGGQLVEGTEALDYQYTNGKEGIPRIDFTDNTDGHLLLEPQSTNLLPYSEDFTQSHWGKHTDIVLTPNQTSPDGSNNAYKVQGTIGSSYILDGGWSAITPQSRSIYMKADTNGVVYSLGDNQSHQINVTTEWQRFELQEVSNSIYAVDFRGSGVTLDTVYIWGAQLEEQSYPTSYIPTNGSTVTRDAETCTDAGEAIDFNSEEGVLYAEIAALADNETYRFISLNDGTTQNRVVLGYHNVSNTIRGFVYSRNSIVCTMSYVVTDIKDFYKAAIKYKLNDFALWVDGVERGVDGAGEAPIGLDTLQFDSGGGSSIFYGKCKAIRVYKEALSDSELTTLTS